MDLDMNFEYDFDLDLDFFWILIWVLACQAGCSEDSTTGGCVRTVVPGVVVSCGTATLPIVGPDDVDVRALFKIRINAEENAASG